MSINNCDYISVNRKYNYIFINSQRQNQLNTNKGNHDISNKLCIHFENDGIDIYKSSKKKQLKTC